MAVVVALIVSLATASPPSVSIFLSLFIVILVALRIWMLRGAVIQASYSMAFIFVLGVTAISAALGSIFSAISGYYILAIVIAGLLLDSRAMVVTGGLSLFAIGCLTLMEELGFLPPPALANPVRDWIATLVLFINTGFFIHLTRLRYLDELYQRQQAEQTARKSEARYRQLYFSAQRQTQELALLDRVRLALARELDFSSIIRTVVEGIADTFDYSLVTLYLLENDLLVNQHQVGYQRTIMNIPISQGITGRVARTGKPELVEDVFQDADFIGDSDDVISEVAVPLFDQGRVAGVLNVESSRGISLKDADLQIITALSEHVSIAIERARLYASIQKSEASYRQLYATAQRQAQELALLDRVRLAIAGELDLPAIIHSVVEAIADTFGYTLVSLYLLEGDHLVLQHQVGYSDTISVIPINQGISGKVVRSGQAVLIEDVSLESDFLGAIDNIVSELCIPLRDHGEVAGTLNVESTQGVKLTEADLHLITALSEQINIALSRARLYTAIQTSEERYRTLAETAPDAIFILDRQGNITYANSTAATGFGLQQGQIIRQNLAWLLKDFDADLHMDVLNHIFETGQSIQSEDCYTYAGKTSWVDTKFVPIHDKNGAVAALLGIARDITERKLSLEALQKRTRELTALNNMGRQVSASLSLEQVAQSGLEELNSSLAPDLVFLLIRQGAEFKLCNAIPRESQFPSLLSGIHKIDQGLYGLSVSLGKPLYSLATASDPRCASQQYQDAGLQSLAALPLMGNNEVIGVLGLASSSERDFAADANFLETLANQLAAGIQNALLHEQQQLYAQRLEERVRQRTGELEAKNRELETFSYSVSHDLKSPLRGIDGYSRLLLSDYSHQLNQEAQTFLHNIRLGVNRMSQLIDDLLAYTHLERREILPTQIEPRFLIQNLIAEFEEEPNKPIAFQLDLPIFTIRADRESLAQALRNLIDNAIKFSRNSAEPRVEIGGWETPASWVVFVRDNGIGFDMKYADRIFEIFNRLNRNEDYPGTGVGLALVRKAMERMGGRAWVESLPGQGATFYLELPK